MPTRSRNARTKARQKRTMSLLKRSLRETAFQANKNFSTVLMLLAQAGGEVIVSTETIQSTVNTIAKAQYAVENTPEGVRIHIVVADTVVTDDAADVDLDALKAKMQAAHNVPTFEPPAGSVTAQLAERGAESGERQDADGNTMSDVAPVDPTIAAEDPA